MTADISQANASFASMGKTMANALGVGAAGGAAAQVLQTSADFQTAMSRVQQAYNRVDFAPGTSNFSDASNAVLRVSGSMATSFDEVAASMAQAAKITDQFGDKLPTSKVDEFVDANLRLSKSSQDSMSAIASGQNMAMFDKMFSSQDFKGTGSAVAALTTQHPQSEQTLWQAALGIARIGAPLGVTQAQALGVGNYLSDVGGGGQTGGASIGRMLLRMDTSADQVLDPEAAYSTLKKNRDAQEKLDDLQTSLKEAEAQHAQMYGQHGLKTAYRRNPEALVASDDRIAKLNREIADQKEDILHENDPNRARARGVMNVAEMAKTAGQSADAFAELFKDNPMEALLDFTTGLHDLPATARGAAMTKAGITNVRDQGTISLLSDQPESVRRMISIANGELVNPQALDQISNIGLGTASAHLEDLHNTLRGGMAQAGMPDLANTDKGVQAATSLIQNGDWGQLQKNLADSASKFDGLNGPLETFSPVFQGLGLAAGFALPAILKTVLAGGGTGAASTALAGAGGFLGAAGPFALLLGGAGAGGKALTDAGAFGPEGSRPGAGEAFSSHNGPLFQINIDNVGHNADQAFEAIKAQFVAAWNAAMAATPVSGAMGGNIGGGSP